MDGSPIDLTWAQAHIGYNAQLTHRLKMGLNPTFSHRLILSTFRLWVRDYEMPCKCRRNGHRRQLSIGNNRIFKVWKFESPLLESDCCLWLASVGHFASRKHCWYFCLSNVGGFASRNNFLTQTVGFSSRIGWGGLKSESIYASLRWILRGVIKNFLKSA